MRYFLGYICSDRHRKLTADLRNHFRRLTGALAAFHDRHLVRADGTVRDLFAQLSGEGAWQSVWLLSPGSFPDAPTYYMQHLYATRAGERPLRLRPAFSVDAVPDCSATLSADGKTVTLFAVNPTTHDVSRTLDFTAFGSGPRELTVWMLADTQSAGEPDVANSFAEPQRIVPGRKTVHMASARLSYRFPALSLTVLSWRTDPTS